MNNLTTVNDLNSFPSRINPQLDHALSVASNKLNPDGYNQFSISFEDRLSSELLNQIDSRARDLVSFAQPAQRRDVEFQVMTLATMLGLKKMSDAEADVFTTMYVDILIGVPLYALKKACERCLKREGPFHNRGAFVPEPADIRADALAICQPFDAELDKISRVLSARIEQPSTSQERRKLMVEKCMAEYAAAKAKADAADKFAKPKVSNVILSPAEGEAALEEMRARFKREPIKASPELLALIERQKQESAA